MKLMEWILVLVTIAAAVCIPMYSKRRKLVAGMFAAMILAVALQGILDSFRVMLLPTYLVAGIIFIVLIIKLVKGYRNRVTGQFAEKQKPKWRSWLQLTLVGMLALVSGAGSGLLTWYFPAFTMPEPTGKFAIGTFSQQLVDETREETFSPESGDKRELMINVWYPVNPEDAKGYLLSLTRLNSEKQLVWYLASRLRCSATSIPFRHMWLKAQPCQTQAVLIRWCCSLPVSARPVIRA
ncbi:hypothetical protein MT997_34090 [Paenibacillus sp. OVF10]|nr:hypothetical protein MT997_34090 [Paenibacillus sp. OVF10]